MRLLPLPRLHRGPSTWDGRHWPGIFTPKLQSTAHTPAATSRHRATASVHWRFFFTPTVGHLYLLFACTSVQPPVRMPTRVGCALPLKASHLLHTCKRTLYGATGTMIFSLPARWLPQSSYIGWLNWQQLLDVRYLFWLGDQLVIVIVDRSIRWIEGSFPLTLLFCAFCRVWIMRGTSSSLTTMELSPLAVDPYLKNHWQLPGQCDLNFSTGRNRWKAPQPRTTECWRKALRCGA